MEALEARLARAVASALLEYAEAVERRTDGQTDEDQAEIVDAELPSLRGPRQKEIVDVLMSAPDDGMKTGEIARTIGMDQANAYLALQALLKQGIAELVPGSDPQHWRLQKRYRARRQILKVASLILGGEVTTYGDISRVVYGHFSGALAVGRVAATATDFPAPHRVLERGGLIPTEWHTTDGAAGIEECIRRLKSDGLKVEQADGRYFVAPTRIVGWEALADRLRGSGSHE